MFRHVLKTMLRLSTTCFALAIATALESAVEWMNRHPDQTTAERIVLLYAWNEFGEGGYLTPTKGDPNGAYLDVVKRVVERAKP